MTESSVGSKKIKTDLLEYILLCPSNTKNKE